MDVPELGCAAVRGGEYGCVCPNYSRRLGNTLKMIDTVVQNGTRHAWRNKSSEPCRMVVFLLGAHRSG